jgi:hypothetical protein
MTDTSQVLLAHHLKALKLPTVLHEYDKVGRQCAAEGTGYARYLLWLAELEPIARHFSTSSPKASEVKFGGRLTAFNGRELGRSADLVAFSHLQFSQIRGRQPYSFVRKIPYVIL